ncbi:MAG: RidA family protein [Chloroflexi bacterium AL-W]|nr:RidA family protein [Chloroflexi bacterium AL-N1]NOK64899.1 RidA family protein [Chloroflexi bacterium AL-N10]NOK76669.1 RidA family protein [Chloroflexi bacterium AL-N5]NOK84560.1 RidA family protein [Chloroflexi bacterium AL-W]NOK86615.1 RidA family protein [Chloroflexi bacterium AL-N15]
MAFEMSSKSVDLVKRTFEKDVLSAPYKLYEIIANFSFDGLPQRRNDVYLNSTDPFPVNDPYHGIYVYGVETCAGARVLHISGQVGVSEDGVLPADFYGQCKQAILNVEAVLREADMTLSDIVKMSFFLVRREDMDILVEVRKELLDGVRPAITTLFVAGLVSPDWLVEVEVVACAE